MLVLWDELWFLHDLSCRRVKWMEVEDTLKSLRGTSYPLFSGGGVATDKRKKGCMTSPYCPLLGSLFASAWYRLMGESTINVQNFKSLWTQLRPGVGIIRCLCTCVRISHLRITSPWPACQVDILENASLWLEFGWACHGYNLKSSCVASSNFLCNSNNYKEPEGFDDVIWSQSCKCSGFFEH